MAGTGGRKLPAAENYGSVYYERNGYRKDHHAEGDYKIEDTIAILTDEEGNDIPVTMIQRWPVKRAMTNYKEKPRPFKLLETGVRVIDTLNPIVEGGTGFIPARSVQVRRCFSTLSPNRRKRIS